ncbi:LPS-assembly protein LptD [Thiopseudomonas denitrificans]|uniref:LPS-assembly protein LptD n=1 Tax=Thiopseudomonas denitrificans TaxID=1501432 RepID=A0A4R6TTC5_9GAMM|nr:LPS-assembly protein LptD [Thiopseudomonas denitrificans]TDQ34781.1 LPS-assembly protein [Thiopseudomonas denitrificans]
MTQPYKVLRPTALALGIFAALHPFAAQQVLANEFNCTVGPNGQWLCVTEEKARVAPRPATAPAPMAPASQQQTVSTPAATGQPASDESGAVDIRRSTAANPYAHLDWIPRDQLSAAQLEEIAPYCAGTYIEPARLGKDDNTPLNQSPIFASADSSSYNQPEQITTLDGNVILRQASLQFTGDSAELNQQTSLGRLDGNVSLRDRDVLIVGDHARIQLDSGEAQIDNAEYVLHEMQSRGTANYIKRQEEGIIRLKNGSYTSCVPGNNDWHLQSNNITLNPDTGFGTATNVTLRVKNIPVFYTPYIHFPIDDRRQSGFLPPSVSYSRRKGVDLTTPYYINLAPHMDATLYPNYMSERGLLTEGEFRYLTKKSEGMVGGAWLGDDQEKERKRQSEYKKDRWMYTWQHQHGFNNRLLAEIDYTDISDPYYFQDLSSNIRESSDTTVDQRASLRWRGDSYTAGLNLHAYERANVTDITPHNKLPQLTLNGRVPGEWGGLQLAYQSELVRFERSLKKGSFTDRDGEVQQWRDTRLSGIDRADGSRLHLEPSLSMPMSWSWGFVKPALKYAYTRYDLDLDRKGKDDLLANGRRFKQNASRSVPIASIDSGLYFDRPSQMFGKQYTQTLEPRLFYLYVPYEDQLDIPLFDTSESSFTYSSLWRDNRFTGRDRIGDTNQISLGLTWRWLEESGFERQRAAIGQAYYLSDRKVMLSAEHKDDYKLNRRNTASRSPYATQYMLRFNQDWRLNADWAWDPNEHRTRTGSLMFNYQPQDNLNKIINFGYRYSNDGVYFDEDKGRWVTGSTDYYNSSTGKTYKDFYKIEQTDASIMWPVFQRWNAIARWQFDYNRSRTLDAFGGFEYSNCCWKVRLIQRYWVDYDERSMSPEDNRRPDRGIFLQVILKGLGGVTGNKVGTFLDEGIPGYQRREQHGY